MQLHLCLQVLVCMASFLPYIDVSQPVDYVKKKRNSKGISVKGRGGLWDCEVSRIPHFPYSRLTVGLWY
jgi:hypothetical protein